MKVAIIYNKNVSKVINTFGMQNRELYNPKTVQAVAKSLENGGHNVGIIDGDMHVIERLHDFMPKVVEGEKMGIVFNMAYGIQGESRYTHIPSMLEMLGIPYVGSSPAGHALALDKVVTKIILQQHNLPTPNFWVFSSPDFDTNDVVYPVIVKPKMESVSFGLKIVYNDLELRKAADFIIQEFQQPALVEQFIEGREFAVGLLGNNPLEAFPILEIDLDNDPKAIQSFDDKSKTPRGKICPANLSPEQEEEIIRISKDSFNALQLKDFARVDLRMDADGNIHILELNSMASLGPTGSYPFAANVAGYNYQALVNKMLDVAVNRYFTTTEFASEADKFYKKVPPHIRMRGFIRSKQSQTESLLKEMVNINSHIKNVEGIKKISNILKKQLSGLGFSHETFQQLEVGNCYYFSNSHDENIDILLLGNLDNDVNLSAHEHFEESENKLFGTGIWENKSGLAIVISALQAIRFIKYLKKIKVGILLTSDDAAQGKYSSEIIKKLSSKSNYVLGLHGAFLDGGLVTSRSGSAVYKMQVSLKKSNEPIDVAKATSSFLKLLSDITALSDSEKGIMLSPHDLSLISNITEPFVHGSTSLSVRFGDTDQMKDFDSKIKTLISKRKNKYSTLHFEGGIRRPSMIKTDSGSYVFEKIKKLGNTLDINLREEHRWSSADICFVEDNIMKIDGIGAAGAKPNKKAEFVLKHSLLERATLLASLFMEISNESN